MFFKNHELKFEYPSQYDKGQGTRIVIIKIQCIRSLMAYRFMFGRPLVQSSSALLEI
jgi:hypothetical protein